MATTLASAEAAVVDKVPTGLYIAGQWRDATGGGTLAVEDPATGAAAAAFGAYLRELGLVTPPVRLTLHQGHDLGRPSLLLVDLTPDDDRVRVTGHAVPIPAPR